MPLSRMPDNKLTLILIQKGANMNSLLRGKFASKSATLWYYFGADTCMLCRILVEVFGDKKGQVDAPLTKTRMYNALAGL